MSYLRVDCGICYSYWNYYDEKYEAYPQTTGIPLQGCVCPYCGNIGWLRSSAGNTAQAATSEQKD